MKVLISVLFGITCGCIVLCLAILIRFFLFLRDFDRLVDKYNHFVYSVIHGEIKYENNEQDID